MLTKTREELIDKLQIDYGVEKDLILTICKAITEEQTPYFLKLLEKKVKRTELMEEDILKAMVMAMDS